MRFFYNDFGCLRLSMILCVCRNPFDFGSLSSIKRFVEIYKSFNILPTCLVVWYKDFMRCFSRSFALCLCFSQQVIQS